MKVIYRNGSGRHIVDCYAVLKQHGSKIYLLDLRAFGQGSARRIGSLDGVEKDIYLAPGITLYTDIDMYHWVTERQVQEIEGTVNEDYLYVLNKE